MVPQSIDDEFLQCAGDGIQPPGVPSCMEGFVFSLSIFDILHDVLAVIYSPHESKRDGDHGNQHRKAMHKLVDTLSLNSRLNDLMESIPDHLKLPKPSENAMGQSRFHFDVQAQVLHCRFVFFHI
jgi:hypothetical protein